MREGCSAGDEVAARFRALVQDGAGELALPGSGKTWSRFRGLAAVAETDLSVARLFEGHADALAILAEAAAPTSAPEASYGVWAARGEGGVTAREVAGGFVLDGRKPFCSGAALIDRALVTAEAPDGYRLFDVAVGPPAVTRVAGSWLAVGMAGSASDTVVFTDAVVPAAAAIGPPGYYLNRPGFWFGACGVAACWAGGAAGLVSGIVPKLRADAGDLLLAELGRAVAVMGAMHDVLRATADAIDRDPTDEAGLARVRALTARQIVHDACIEVLNRTTAAGGAGPLCHDPEQARRAADLVVYLAQHHGGADAVELGRRALEGPWWD